MARTLKTALLLLMLALVPIRGLAAATTGFCTFAHPQAGTAAHGGHDSHEGYAPGHGHDSDCGTCGEHCSSAAFAPSARFATFIDGVAEERLVLAARPLAGFIADQLDRPPLQG